MNSKRSCEMSVNGIKRAVKQRQKLRWHNDILAYIFWEKNTSRDGKVAVFLKVSRDLLVMDALTRHFYYVLLS